MPADAARPPVWLLDVDGVVNALDPSQSAWPDVTTFEAAGFTIRWSPGMLARIADLHARGRAEVWWLTTWEDAANVLLAPRLGLPELVVASTREEAALRGAWWKLPVAQRVRRETGRRLVWTDDDLARLDEAQEWIEQQHGEVLGVSPSAWTGLTPQDLDLIESWL